MRSPRAAGAHRRAHKRADGEAKRPAHIGPGLGPHLVRGVLLGPEGCAASSSFFASICAICNDALVRARWYVASRVLHVAARVLCAASCALYVASCVSFAVGRRVRKLHARCTVHVVRRPSCANRTWHSRACDSSRRAIRFSSSLSFASACPRGRSHSLPEESTALAHPPNAPMRHCLRRHARIGLFRRAGCARSSSFTSGSEPTSVSGRTSSLSRRSYARSSSFAFRSSCRICVATRRCCVATSSASSSSESSSLKRNVPLHPSSKRINAGRNYRRTACRGGIWFRAEYHAAAGYRAAHAQTRTQPPPGDTHAGLTRG
jgi:hypothetical protein